MKETHTIKASGITRLRMMASIILVFLLLLILVPFIIATYERMSSGTWPEITGIMPYTDPSQQFYRGKTLWDLLELLIIPTVLAFGVFWLNQSTRKAELEIARKKDESEKLARENQEREAELQDYLDKMTELILDKGLTKSGPDDPIRSVARSRTLTVLRMLDGTRKGLLLQFVYESDLISRQSPIIDMRGADLSDAELVKANLYNANLSGIIFRKADLREAILEGSDLTKANLDKANLYRASLRGANLKETSLVLATLEEASVAGTNFDLADLSQSNLKRATFIQSNFSDARLMDVDLSEANLSDSSFFGASLASSNLRLAILNNTSLYWADLTQSNLRDAIVTQEQLRKSRSLDKATLPDGKVYSQS
jgi:uncharacterized protein YjbI with pentapeptide repeats